MSSKPIIDIGELKMNIKRLMPMEDTQLEIFLKGMKVRTFKKGEHILSAGQTEKYLSIVISGLTRHLVKEKEDISFDFSFKNDFSSSYASFIQRKPSQFFIEALQPTVLTSFSYNYLHKLYKDYPGSNRFGRLAIEQYFILREKRELSLLMDNATERYKKLLKEHPEYIQQIPLKYLASYLNIKPESLSRIRKRIK
jgi:CRP-like cAMP-binding protein